MRQRCRVHTKHLDRAKAGLEPLLSPHPRFANLETPAIEPCLRKSPHSARLGSAPHFSEKLVRRCAVGARGGLSLTASS